MFGRINDEKSVPIAELLISRVLLVLSFYVSSISLSSVTFMSCDAIFYKNDRGPIFSL